MKHTEKAEKAKLIAGLNEDLAHEYAAIIQYRTFASMIRGPHRMTLRPLFAGEIADELEHAGMLADRIVALGGTPVVQPAPVPIVESSAAMLRHVLEAERASLATYIDRRQQAEAVGEHGLAVALDDLISDETRHRDEMQLVLSGWTDATADQGIEPADVVRGGDRPARDGVADDRSMGGASRQAATPRRTDRTQARR